MGTDVDNCRCVAACGILSRLPQFLSVIGSKIINEEGESVRGILRAKSMYEIVFWDSRKVNE